MSDIADEPIEFLRRNVPEMYGRGAKELLGEADRASDVKGANRLFRMRYSGDDGTDAWLRVRGDTLSVLDASDGGAPLAAASLPIETARDIHERAMDAHLLSRPALPRRLARVLTHPRLSRLDGEKVRFRVVIEDGPTGDDIEIDIALGGADLDGKPECTARVSYDDIEDVRGGKMSTQQLMTSGRMKLEGNAARLMQLGMKMMQS